MNSQNIHEGAEHSHHDPVEKALTASKVLLAETVRWPNLALLAVDLARAGSNVSAVCPADHPLLKTRAVQQTFHYSGFRPLKSLSAAIKATNPQIIIPCDERAVQHLHELHAGARRLGASGNEMAALIENSLGSPENYPVVCNRSKILRIARDLDLRVPDTEPLATVGDLKIWQTRHAFPWLLKVDGTFSSYGVKIAHSLEQAERSWLELSRMYNNGGRAIKRFCVNRDAFWMRPWWNNAQPVISVQSYIRGRPANCAVLCWKGKVLAGIGVEVARESRPSGPAAVVRVVDNSDMMPFAERIAGRLGLSGFIGLDFIIEEGSGLAYLIEMNPRPTRVSHLRLGKGRDMVGALCAQLSGKPVRESPPVTQKEMIAYFPDAWSPRSELLESSYQDVPEEEPDLVQELLKPWPPKGILWHLANQVEHIKTFLRGSDSKGRPGNEG